MREKEKSFISAVIYVRDCEAVIHGFFDILAGTIDEYFEKGEIICVNDACTDNSMGIIRDCAASYPHINTTILNLDSFHGRESAMQGGMGLAIGDFVWEFDHPYDKVQESDLMDVYFASKKGADIVAAVCERGGRTSSGLFYRLFNRFADIPAPIGSDCYRILSRRAINRVYSQNNIIAYRKAAYAECGLRSETVKINDRPDTKDSRESRKARRSLAADSLLMFTNVGFAISLIMTITMMAILIIFAVYAVVVRIMGRPVEGWTSTVLLISFGFFGIFGVLTVITKYLQLLIKISIRRRPFAYQSIEKLN